MSSLTHLRGLSSLHRILLSKTHAKEMTLSILRTFPQGERAQKQRNPEIDWWS